ncbi:MAG: enoyl-CoA hydratase-related protein, partial [Saprospiraceae bacterium]
MSYQHFLVEITEGVATVAFNRPDKANALHQAAWDELPMVFNALHEEETVRVIVLSGTGNHFCAGIDLGLLMSLQSFNDLDCEARKREKLLAFIRKLQQAINAIEAGNKPVIAAIHGACVGGGLDIAAACDMRFCSADARFSVKEID